MPPIGMALGGVDFAQLKIVLRAATGGDPATEVAIRYGNFLNAVHRLRHHRLRRVAALETVHQGSGGGPGAAIEDVPLLPSAERG